MPAGNGPGDAARHWPELDGLRGWAALAVLIFHLFYEAFGVRFPEFRNDLTGAFNGSLAVSLFFALSGQVLGAGLLAERRVQPILIAAVKRHPRLALPILASVLLVWALHRLGLVEAAEAARIVGRTDWLGFATPPADLASYGRYALLDVFASNAPSRQLVPFLWTMAVELAGSLLLFGLLLATARLPFRRGLFALVFLALMLRPDTANLACFVAGAGWAWLRQEGVVARVAGLRFAPALSGLAILAALGASACTPLIHPQVHALTALVLLGAVQVNGAAVRFLTNGLSRWLGGVSFTLYLTHYAVLISLTSALIVRADAAGGLDRGCALGIIVVSVVAALGLAALFAPVDRWGRRVSGRVGRWFAGPHPPLYDGLEAGRAA